MLTLLRDFQSGVNADVVKTSGGDVKVSLYQLGDRVMAVACSVGDDATHTIKLDIKKLGLPSNVTASDLEGIEGLKTIRPGEVSFPLKRLDYRLILFRPKS